MTTEQDLLALVDTWCELYNDDAARMVRECYAEACRVYPMGLGIIEGHEGLLAVEAAVLAKAPQRRMRVERRHVSGNVVCVEAILLNPAAGADWALPFVAILTVEQGRIVSDRSYADWSRWPGL